MQLRQHYGQEFLVFEPEDQRNVFVEKTRSMDVVPVSGGEAAIRVVGSARQACGSLLNLPEPQDRKNLKLKMFSCACKLVKHVRAYRLRTTRNGKFWEAMEKALSNPRTRLNDPRDSRS